MAAQSHGLAASLHSEIPFPVDGADRLLAARSAQPSTSRRNVLFKTTDEGKSWSEISARSHPQRQIKQVAAGGPLTKDNTGVEVYDTIFSVVESPVQKGLIWAGSDDGLIHITRDAGAHWEDITPKAIPEWGTVSMIEADPRDAGTAYAAVERHKSDDFTPYIFKTSDFGKSWTPITNGIPKDVYVHAVRVDPKRKGLLYAGTERGVYLSFDDGANWQAMQLNLPVSPVNDLIVKNNDLAVATHGRAFWVLDDLSPLQQWQDDLKNENAHLFAPRAANHTVFSNSFFGEQNAGQNPPSGAILYYYLKNEIKKPEAKKDDASSSSTDTKPEDARIKIEILDAGGKVIRTYPPKTAPIVDAEDGETPHPPDKLPTDAGINRFVWDLRYEGATRIPKSPLWGGSTDGPLAVPGKYQARFTLDGQSQTQPLEIVPDPRLKLAPADYQAQFDLVQKINGKVTQVHDAIQQMRDVRSQMDTLNKRMKQTHDANEKALADAGSALDKKMTPIEEELVATKAKSGQDILNYPMKLNNLLVALGGVVSSADAAPTRQDLEIYDEISKQADEQIAKWNDLVKSDLANYNNLARQDNVPAISLLPGTGR